MSLAKMTLIGFHNYMKSINDDLFMFLKTPAGIDKDLLINTILMNGGEFEVLWGDPYFYQNMIGVWSDKWQHTMTKWYEAINAHYDPVENYDRIEDWSDKSSKVSTGNSAETNERKEHAVANDYSKSTGSGSTENTRSAFDASDYQPHDKAASSTSGENVSSGATAADGKTTSNTKTNSVDAANNTHSGRIHGNIGVKTAQSMIGESLELYNWNLYNAIADLFLGEMVIRVYD